MGMANLASQIDFSTLASNPTQVLALLPQMGFSQQCQQNIMGAGAVCLTDFQSLGSLMSDPDVAAEIQKVTGVNVSSAPSHDPEGAPHQRRQRPRHDFSSVLH